MDCGGLVGPVALRPHPADRPVGRQHRLMVQPKRLNAARSGQATQSEVIGAIVVEESPCLLHGL